MEQLSLEGAGNWHRNVKCWHPRWKISSGQSRWGCCILWSCYGFWGNTTVPQHPLISHIPAWKWNEEMCCYRCLHLKYLLTAHLLRVFFLWLEMKGVVSQVEILLRQPVLNEAALRAFFLSLTAGEVTNSKQHSQKITKKSRKGGEGKWCSLLKLISLSFCSLWGGTGSCFVWRMSEVTQDRLCGLHSPPIYQNGILVSFSLWSLETHSCRSSGFHCDVSAVEIKMTVRSASKLSGISGVA